MKIVLDRNIPFIEEPLARVGEVTALPASEITPGVMADADVLICRTRTRCDESLLGESRCRFVGTATIGTDHIDLGYCRSRGIEVANAPGCNAPGVAQWVLASISATIPEGCRPEDVTLGVVGAGHVGSILIRWALGLGMRVLVNDPPLQEFRPDAYDFSPLEELAKECDYISVHTPLTVVGKHPTFHLIDGVFVDSLVRKPVILNAARGPVADTAALLGGLRSGKIRDVAMDCWEGEPLIDPDLLDMAKVATPHIAGYTIQGKIRASQMVLDALYRHLALGDAPRLAPGSVPMEIPGTIRPASLNYSTLLPETEYLKRHPGEFESLRNNYPLRPEPTA